MECNGKKISELEERTSLTGNEFIVFQDQDYNGKIALYTLSKGIGEHVDFDATATAVQADTASAEVNLVANTFNFKFQIPKGEKGDPGKDGSTGTLARPVFAYTVSDTQPATPTGGSWDYVNNILRYPNGWSASPAMDGIVWMSQTVFFADGTSDPWSEPIRIVGKDGENGKDGQLYQYIYTRTESTTPVPTRPVSSQTEEVPTGWTDNPQGITETLKVEWTCVRTKDIEGKWSDYSTPTIWSRWGENGKDGDGVEYIFTRTTQEVKPERPTESPNVDEYIPPQGSNEEQWHDDPVGVDAVHRWEWVSIRKQKSPEDAAATWGTWSDPSLWAYYAKDGEQGAAGNTPDHQSFFFKNSESKPEKPTFTNPLSPTDGWVDSVTGNGTWWCCVASVNGQTGLIESWSEVFSVNGISFRTVNAYKSTGESEDRPATPTGGSWNPNTDAITYPSGWSGLDELGGIVWESQATFNSLGSQTKSWSTPTRITGPNGENGTDGLTIEFIYTRTKDDSKPELVITDSENVNDYLPGDNGQVGSNPETWTDNPRGITDEWRTEWMSQRTKDTESQTWGNWIEPVRWSRWGQNGRDGDGVEYVFVRTKREQTPTTPTDSPNVDEYEPTIDSSQSSWVEGPTWIDDPLSPTTDWPYVYVTQRKQQSPEDASATWGKWSTPSLWAMYGHTGDSIEFRMRAHSSATSAPALDKSSRNPSGWTVGNPVVTSTNKYVWMTAAKINTENELVGEWSDPWNTTGEDGNDGQGGTGEAGPMGPQGIAGLPGVSIEVRYSKGTETSYTATWNSTVRSTRDPSSYGWTIMPPSIDSSSGEKLWFIQARIATRYINTTDPDEPGYLETETYLEDGAWNEPSLYGSEQGADGIGITNMNTYYAVTSSESNIPDKNAELGGSVWHDTAPVYNNNTQVLWQLFVVNYTNGVEDRLGPTPIIPGRDGSDGEDGKNGEDGKDGSDGVGIQEIYEEYYLSTSPTELTGGEWSRTWSWQAGKYTWQRTTVVYTDDSKWTSDPICASGPEGSSGEGNAGPIVYPAGVYDINKTYTATSQKAPYVFDPTDTSDEPDHTGNYYFLNSTAVSGWKGSLQEEGNQYPSQNAVSSNPVWVKMESFDAMYANIGVFGNALVGSAVFNGDYMFSQQGIDSNGDTSSHYENFNSKDPYNTSNSFRPNICINYKTGQMWTSSGKCIFNTDGSGKLADGSIEWDINGNVSANYFKSNVYQVSSGTVHLNTIKQPIIECTGTTLTLVLDDDQLYREFSIRSNPSNTSEEGTIVTFQYAVDGEVNSGVKVLAAPGAYNPILYISKTNEFKFRFNPRMCRQFTTSSPSSYNNCILLDSMDGKNNGEILKCTVNMMNSDLLDTSNLMALNKVNTALTFNSVYAPTFARLSIKTSLDGDTLYTYLSLHIYFIPNVLSNTNNSMFRYTSSGSNSTGINVIVNGEIWRGYKNGAGSGWAQSQAKSWYEKDPVKYEYSMIDNNVLVIDFLNLAYNDSESMFNGTIEVYGATPLLIYS